ncbi:MAG: NAD(P)H-dependent oxidoreductase subunit E [Syntrophaceae bacterium]|jgi:NADH:ubiquinone oxidoreductase subunit E|nr:NAD(P)H-dependent oxidoreductase subunit E [Syntrophaceae bacterium]
MMTAKTKKITVKDIIKKYGGDKTAMIAILQDVQEEFRYLPKAALSSISKQMEVPLTRIYEIATFYNAFSLKQRGKNLVELCAGTACHVQGAARLMDRLERDLAIKCGETTKDKMFSLEEVRCLGCCSLAPVVRISGDIHPNLTQDEIPKILKNYL